jgi:hypothetical protein
MQSIKAVGCVRETVGVPMEQAANSADGERGCLDSVLADHSRIALFRKQEKL